MEFNVNPYYDDFESTGGPKDSNYMRILFKPGSSVQARELTQIQSIIQNQIKQFGDHIFKDGSPVFGGELSLDVNIRSIKLLPQYNLEDLSLADFNNKLIISETNSSKKAYVVAVDDTQQYPTLMIRYLSGNEFSDGETIKIADNTSTKATLISPSASTVGSTISINDGVFYVNGYFVQVGDQTIVLDPYSTVPTYRVGLEIAEDIIDSTEDSTLLDPAQTSFNYQAPGADRYQFDLVLAHRTLSSTDDSSFFELLRVENGEITKQVNYPIYSELEKTLARRTYDESGNYTVNAWRAVPVANTANTTQFDLELDKGKAYVKGYEFETQGTTTLTVDKARTSNVSSDYELSVEYGNYAIVKNLFGGNVSGMFDTTSYELVDLHCVPSANINTASSSAYSNTKIGTARVRNITNRGDGSTYYMYLIDTNTSPMVVNVASSSTLTTFVLPSTLSHYSNAYNNVVVSVLAGPSQGDSRKIISYDASTKTAVVDRGFTTALTSSSQMSFNFAISDLESITITPTTFTANVYGTKNASSAMFACADIDTSSKTNRDVDGETYLYSTDLNRLVFKFPETYIKNGSFTDVTHYQTKLRSITFTGGVATMVAGTGGDFESFEEIYYGPTGGYLSALQIQSNFLVVANTTTTGNVNPGSIIDFTRIGANILKTTSQQISLNSGHSGNFVADVFYNIKVNNPTDNNTRRTKNLRGNSSVTTLRTTDSPSNGTSVTGDTSVKYESANGFVWFTSYSGINKTPGVKQSLYIPDVFNIVKIYDSGNPLYAPNTSNATDITGNYLFDSGQNDNYYDHASIILKDTASPPRGQIAVMLQYFEHTGSGYFNADSYDYATVYSQEKIPLYSSKKYAFSLRDAIDFRPTRTIGTTAFTLSNNRTPYPDLSMVLTYGFYLPRIDKLIATQNREFKLLSGTPAFVPVEPADSDEGMTLYTLYVPPFTANIRDIKLRYFENRRYTMRDIAALDKRLQQVEYYTTLSLLENKARSQAVLYQDSSLQKEKYGILVDQFDGFNIADNRSPDLVCQLSFNELRPYKITNEFPLRFANASGVYQLNDRTYSLSFTETPIVSQNFATKAITVQPYLFAQFNGVVKLTPETDYWMSVQMTPIVVSPPNDTVTPATPPVVAPTVPATGGVNRIVWANDFGNGTPTRSNFVGFGFVNWNQFLNITPTVPVPSDSISDAITAPDISNSLAISGGGGAALRDERINIARN
jgi:hypothetical protein